MGTATWTTFFAILALTANLGVAALAVGRLRGGTGWADVRSNALWLAWLVAVTATLGSLYYSEVAGFEPCRLCWYQRIAMYPLAVILGIAAWRHDGAVRRYALPLAVVGGAIAGYHYALQRFPDLDAGACTVGIPCSAIWVERFGFVTIPYMALSGFALVAALLLVAPRKGP